MRTTSEGHGGNATSREARNHGAWSRKKFQKSG